MIDDDARISKSPIKSPHSPYLPLSILPLCLLFSIFPYCFVDPSSLCSSSVFSIPLALVSAIALRYLVACFSKLPRSRWLRSRLQVYSFLFRRYISKLPLRAFSFQLSDGFPRIRDEASGKYRRVAFPLSRISKFADESSLDPSLKVASQLRRNIPSG